ncbi:MAG: glycosyltransferase [Trueperaceae bacterium]|nr:glycosyltransferase [Trueperaceae bacterium]
MARLALFLPSLAGGGAERVLVDLAEGFARRGHRVDLVLAAAEGPYLKTLSEAVNVIDLGVRRTLSATPKLRAYLTKTKPDALLSTLEHANVVAVLANKLAGSATKVFIREAISTSNSTMDLGKAKAFVAMSLMRLFYPRADGIVAVSEGVQEDMVKTLGVKPEKIEMILNPVLTERVFKLADEPLDHPWFQTEIPVLLSVGRLTYQKDFPTLLKAFARLRAKRQVRLVILGEGEERDKLEQIASDLEITADLDMPGFVDNPFKYMARASAYVLSSIAEGLPNALIQAMALGRPVVATDCPSGPREILEGGRYGKLIPMGDVEAMTKALTQVLSEPHKAMSDDWVRRYEAETVISQYLEFMAVTPVPEKQALGAHS